MDSRRNESACKRTGGQRYLNNTVCTFWLARRCNRNPCRFLHSYPQAQRYPQGNNPNLKTTWRNPNSATNSSNRAVGSEWKNIQKSQRKLCPVWVNNGVSVRGDNCKDLCSWYSGSEFSLLTKLEAHKKAVTGIVLPSGSNQLLSSSEDETVQFWDCNSGQCVHTVELSSESKCLIAEGPWVYVGLQNAVKVWNFQTLTEFTLNGPNGLVYALVVGDDNLFAGVQDGSILVWKSSFEFSCTQVAATLKGHKQSVLSLAMGHDSLFSGSKDNAIKVWDLKTFQCLYTLTGHTNSVTSVLCWDEYLLSGSLDNTIKVWAASGSGRIELMREVREENGILALSGILDAEAKPILLCSCKDNAVRFYQLPLFEERGRILSESAVQTITAGRRGLFFTGEASGRLLVWELK